MTPTVSPIQSDIPSSSEATSPTTTTHIEIGARSEEVATEDDFEENAGSHSAEINAFIAT